MRSPPAVVVDRPPPADPGSFDTLPVALVTVGADGHVAGLNAMARTLFGSIAPEGLTLAALFGLLGLRQGSEGAFPAGEPGAAPSHVELADGRVLDCRVSPLPGGGAALALFDVSRHRRVAQGTARDALTGLVGRAGLHDQLRVAMAQADRAGTPLAVLCLDLDRFKAVNDTLGHPVGDLLLAKVAERLRGAVREGDIVARLGGDEFAIVQAGTGQPEGSEALATRLVDLVGRTYVVGGHMLNVGVSVGIALFPGDGPDIDTLLKRADLALYRAKADGRSTFRFFEGEMDARMQRRRQLEIDLRRALALREFELAFQPQVRIEAGVTGSGATMGFGAVVGFEALLRWRSPERGTVSPAEFIPLAEEIGLIVPIGEWVLRTACAQAAAWPGSVSIAVNLSPIQFRGMKLVDTVVSALAASGLQPGRLELEITEGALLANTDQVLQTLHALRSLGVRISMDDFGTGYSSLSYLQKFPFDKIKIDQSFVRGMDDSTDCRAIVRAVASLGASLGMRTTAEGVETEEQLARIRAEGCHEVQGYLTGRPLTPDAAHALLLAASPAPGAPS